MHQVHELFPDEVYRFLDSSPQGLSSGDVEERMQELGPNRIEVRDPWKWARILTRQVINFFTVLLTASAIICFVADRIQPGESMNVLAWALLGVSLLNAMFSFLQEYRAERAMEALQKYLPQRVNVLRSGTTVKILSEAVVPGDVLVLTEGDRVPADARLVYCDALMVNNAPLTGESKPVKLIAEAADGHMADSRNIVFAGTTVIKGSGQAVTFATGLRTEFGKIAHLSQAIPKTTSPLEHETARMVHILTIIATTMGVLFFLYGVLTERPIWVNLVFMIGIIVANVPEGLLPTFTLALAMGSLRMARKNVLVKGLSAVEALGAVHVICTDKTGTLTENRLAVNVIQLPLSAAPLVDPGKWQNILEKALVASEVRVSNDGYLGDPLDVAIARSLEAGGGNVAFLKKDIIHHYPFDVDLRRSAGISVDRGEVIFAVKGAWEVLKPLISRISTEDGEVTAGEGALAKADEVVQALATTGLRVIAVAWRTFDSVPDIRDDQVLFETELILGGFLGIEDPLRPSVSEAVKTCHRAGIDVLMITGDHPDTAVTVAARCGIVSNNCGKELVMIGHVLEKLSQEAVIRKLSNGVKVFARTTPEQKMKIVAALKAMGRTVAMTGDGVNDAPALKAADVGVAMGKSGTDVARASAQIILLDDNFSSIVAGVQEGRAVFANIKKFVNYVLVSNGPEILPYLLYIVLPVPLALTIIQILSIDLGTDIIPSMALGQEPPDPEEMQRPPRQIGRGLLTAEVITHSYLFLGLLEALWSLTLFFLVLVRGGWHYGENIASSDPVYRSATGIALATILLMQVGNLIGRRYRSRSGLDKSIFSNRLMLLGIFVQVAFSFSVLYTPVMQRILGTGPVDPGIYTLAWLGIPLIFGFDLIRKKAFLN